MKVKPFGPCDQALWIDVARRCPYATYFHLPAWAELMAAAYPHLSVATRSFRMEDGVTAVLPLLESRSGVLFRGYHSMFPHVYGGPIAERPLNAAEIDQILRSIVTRRTSRLHVFGNPHLAYFRAPRETASDFTHVLDLRPGFAALFKRFHRDNRWSYRRGVRSGLTLHRAESLEDFAEYFRVYQLTRRRWGASATSDHPFRLFKEIHRRRDPNMVLWLARSDGCVIAGDLWLYWNHYAVGWHGAADPAFFKKCPTNFLMTEIIRDACNRGFHCFDWNPSGGHAGVARFKDSFGAQRLFFRHQTVAGSQLYRASHLLWRVLSGAL